MYSPSTLKTANCIVNVLGTSLTRSGHALNFWCLERMAVRKRYCYCRLQSSFHLGSKIHRYRIFLSNKIYVRMILKKQK